MSWCNIVGNLQHIYIHHQDLNFIQRDFNFVTNIFFIYLFILFYFFNKKFDKRKFAFEWYINTEICIFLVESKQYYIK